MTNSKLTKMKDFLKKFHFEKLSLKTGFLNLDISWDDSEKNAAWELYVELITRVATQPLAQDEGNEITALESLHNLFPITRGILKDKGRTGIKFSKISIVILNQIIRPFTTKWHKKSSEDCFKDDDCCKEFREELEQLQNDLKNWTDMLAEIADVEEVI